MFEQVVFAGGGNRCWWQAGFWDVVAPAIGLRPRLIGSVSAGAAMACMLYASDARQTLASCQERFRRNRSNFYLRHAFSSSHTMFPHTEIYREILGEMLAGGRFEALRSSAPEIRIQFSRLPTTMGVRGAVFVALLAYNFEKYWRHPLHAEFGRKLGFTPEIARMQDCASPDELVSLLIASSCTPPFTPVQYRNGLPALDGGLVDNVPVDAVDSGLSTLVLLTRRYAKRPQVFVHQGRLYVQPSQRIPVSSWDYTNAGALGDAYQLGLQDGGLFLADWARHRVWFGNASRVQSMDDPKDIQR